MTTLRVLILTMVVLIMLVGVSYADDHTTRYEGSGDQNPLDKRIVIAEAYTCTDWMLQDNGCYWRTCCCNSEGHQWCEQCCGDNCSTVKCN